MALIEGGGWLQLAELVPLVDTRPSLLLFSLREGHNAFWVHLHGSLALT